MSVLDLWLPIVVSAVVVFAASCLAWMVLPHHKKDWVKLPDEAGLTKALTELNVSSGWYMFPHCGGGKEAKSEEFKARWKAGPWGSVHLWPAAPSMARNLVLVFLSYIIVGIFVAYIGGLAFAGQAPEFLPVFRLTGAAAVAAYCLGPLPYAVFMGKPLRNTLNDLIDGIVYGLLTGVVFGLLWPTA